MLCLSVKIPLAEFQTLRSVAMFYFIISSHLSSRQLYFTNPTHGVMIGREAYRNPFLFASADRQFFSNRNDGGNATSGNTIHNNGIADDSNTSGGSDCDGDSGNKSTTDSYSKNTGNDINGANGNENSIGTKRSI